MTIGNGNRPSHNGKETATRKTPRNYYELERETPKAVLVRIEKDDESAVWLPKHRIEIDTAAQTVACTDKLWAEKDADRQRNFAAEKREEREAAWEAGKAMVEIGGTPHKGGKAICVTAFVAEEITDLAISRTVYFPLSQCDEVDGVYRAPLWLVKAKSAEAVYAVASNNGSKGIDHLHGTFWTIDIGGENRAVDVADMQKVAAKNG